MLKAGLLVLVFIRGPYDYRVQTGTYVGLFGEPKTPQPTKTPQQMKEKWQQTSPGLFAPSAQVFETQPNPTTPVNHVQKRPKSPEVVDTNRRYKLDLTGVQSNDSSNEQQYSSPEVVDNRIPTIDSAVFEQQAKKIETTSNKEEELPLVTLGRPSPKEAFTLPSSGPQRPPQPMIDEEGL